MNRIYLFLLTMLAVRNGAIANEIKVYVSPNGKDTWSGRKHEPNKGETDGPFLTLERARDEIRRLKNQINNTHNTYYVLLKGGRHILNQTFKLSQFDSGTKNTRIIYQSYPNETARIIGGRPLTDWEKVPNAIFDNPSGHQNQMIYRTNELTGLFKNEINLLTDPLDLICENSRMAPSRWPKAGYIRIAELNGKTKVVIRNREGTKEGEFTVQEKIPDTIIADGNLLATGHWFWDWAAQTHIVKALDAELKHVSLLQPYHLYGYRKNQWFYFHNVKSELTDIHQWFIDINSKEVFVRATSRENLSKIFITYLPVLLDVTSAENITFRNLSFEMSRNNGIQVTDSKNIIVENCNIINIGKIGIGIYGGENNKIENCTLNNTGAEGIVTIGGDRPTLTPSNHQVRHNKISNFGVHFRTNTPAIRLNGVGITVSNNLLHDGPHQAINFFGNDHVIEGNEIHNVCQDTIDAGAIYGGRDWTQRGTRITNNYIHDLSGFEGRGCVGVYLDDMLSGTFVENNLFYNVDRAILIGGGRDNVIMKNVFANTRISVHIDDRGAGWANLTVKQWIDEVTTKGTLSGMKFDKPPFSKAYPELARILSARPEYAEGNSISNNLFFGSEAKQIKIQTGSLPESTGNTFVPAWPHQTNSIDFPFRLADYFNTQRAVNRFNPFKQYPNRSVPTIVPNEDNLAKCK